MIEFLIELKVIHLIHINMSENVHVAKKSGRNTPAEPIGTEIVKTNILSTS